MGVQAQDCSSDHVKLKCKCMSKHYAVGLGNVSGDSFCRTYVLLVCSAGVCVCAVWTGCTCDCRIAVLRSA